MIQNLKTDVNGNTAIHQRLLMENPLSEDSLSVIMNLISNPDLNINQKNNDDLRYVDLIMMHKELCKNVAGNSFLKTLRTRTELDIGSNNYGDTPLHYAAHADNFSGLIFLNQLSKIKEYVDIKNAQGQTAMHLAASRLNLTSLIALKEVLNANPNLQDAEGNTPGHRLILSLCAYPELGVTEIFTLLQAIVKIGCDFTITNNQGFSMVGIAIDQMSISILDAMLAVNKNLDINNVNTTGCYLLHLAVKKGDYYFAKHLVNKGINIYLKDQNGLTAKEFVNATTNLQQEQWADAFKAEQVASNEKERFEKAVRESDNQLLEIRKLINAN
jgi:ankyrin repeat protein